MQDEKNGEETGEKHSEQLMVGEILPTKLDFIPNLVDELWQ
jgi:hypothetical protein